MMQEKEREAIMRLTMCARRNCAICIYGHNRKRVTVKLPQSCLDRITENMNILAAACDDKNEPKRGEWITTKYHTWECSVCGKNPTTGMGYVQTRKALYNYCPNCGAKMEERE